MKHTMSKCRSPGLVVMIWKVVSSNTDTGYLMDPLSHLIAAKCKIVSLIEKTENGR